MMKYRCHVFFIALCGLCMGCSSDDPVDDSKGGTNGKEEPFPDKGTLFADFETYDTTPYFFRYGNSGSSKISDYYPRWVYSHAVADNPMKSQDNSSAKVLEYTSMEARNYGLKFRFSEMASVGSVRGIRLKIYQPANVIGKDTWKGTSQARLQQLGVKLIGRFNSVNDYEQEEGILLTRSLVDFREEGSWKTYTFAFSKNEYSTADAQLKDGIAGIVVLPTYGSEVTLGEANKYKCYIDDIEIL